MKVDVLERITVAVGASEVSPADFGDIISAAMEVKEGTNEFLGTEFAVNSGTIKLWQRGKNSPHPSVRIVMLKELETYLRS